MEPIQLEFNFSDFPFLCQGEDSENELEIRRMRGTTIAATRPIATSNFGYRVPFLDGNGTCFVALGDQPDATCADFSADLPCEHHYAAKCFAQRLEFQQDDVTLNRPDGGKEIANPLTFSPAQSKATTRTAWSLYNESQSSEWIYFGKLLRDICEGIYNAPYRGGRPRLPMSDIVYCLTARAYLNLSARRFDPEVREAKLRGDIQSAPSYNTILRYMEDPALTILLEELIRMTAAPMRDIEHHFSPDSSGFSTTRKITWFSHKHGKDKEMTEWIKADIMVGAKTNIVTACHASPEHQGDSALFPELLEKTSETFRIKEVSADKAYLSRKNLELVDQLGGVMYVPPKSNSKLSSPKRPHPLWDRLLRLYRDNKPKFMYHYSKRNNVESTFFMIKRKFGETIRAKTPVAQSNEVLAKVLCHNICCLIQGIFEIGLEPQFYLDEADLK